MKKLIIIVAISIAAASAIRNYCEFKHCYGNSIHVACQYDGNFADRCPKDVSEVQITDKWKKFIVDGHNEKRNLFAGGVGEDFKPACRMATMQWDDELAAFAAINVKQCQIEHDTCRSTDIFHYTGQNLALIPYFEPLDLEARLNQTLDMWYNEIDLTSPEWLKSLPEDLEVFEDIGHFTALIGDRNIRVGCAITTYSLKVPDGVPPHMGFLVACNYAAANLPNYAVYKECDVAAEECKTGSNPDYPNLCSVKEEFDYNYGFD